MRNAWFFPNQFLIFLSICILTLLTSCATFPPQNSVITNQDKELTETQILLVKQANTILGAKKLIIEGRRYPLDCTGTIMAIYASAGIDLGREFGKYTGNAVARLYKYLERENLLYITREPVPGDIIFWDNTWDSNEDGKFNDFFTHAGMVVNRLDGDILEYIHYNYRRGIVLERMNLKNPNTRTIMVKGKEILMNSPMRARSAPPAPGKTLASQLTRAFGRAWELES